MAAIFLILSVIVYSQFQIPTTETMNIFIARTDEEILRCYPVMALLRPHLTPDTFLAAVRTQQPEGYMLAGGVDGQVVVVAGYRVQHMLSRGKFMYVDDLVTDGARRSHGYGEQMFGWLKNIARSEGCSLLDLDSGVQRMAAHRFYFRQRMTIPAYHFSMPLDIVPDSAGGAG